MKKGFTLLELLIVIGILAILATTAVLVLNPAELLRQARDSQRISDLQTINSALSLYVTSVSSPSLASTTCGNVFAYVAATNTMGAACAAASPTSTSAALAKRGVAGTDGWLPVNFTGISGGSPLSSLPIDPTNAMGASATANGLIYFYTCDQTNLTWELNGQFESTKYVTTDNVPNKDGGTCSTTYEIGTDPGLNLP